MIASLPKRPLPKHGTAWGVHLSFLYGDVVEFCGHLGFEWLFLDAEHQPLHHHLCRDLTRAADVVGLSCMVRVPEISAAVIEGYLDVGVTGIMGPNVSSAAQATSLVRAVKFPPDGERGSAPRSRAANYGLTQTSTEYCRRANQSTVVAALIESRSGLDQLEDIMAVPGLDYVGIGINDLGLSMGVAAGAADPALGVLVADAQARIRARGIRQIAIVADAERGRAAATAGAGLVAISEGALLASAACSFLKQVRT